MDDYETQWSFVEWLRGLVLFLEGPSFGAARSAKWSAVRNAFIQAHPTCAVCGKKGTLLKPLNAHHIHPFHLHPEDELNPANLITLCRDHHLLYGHLMNWASFNVEVTPDSGVMLGKIEHRP